MSFIIDNKVEFIHIPKTGGCWIEEICRPHIEIAGENRTLGRHVDNVTGRFPTFAVARNPYSWLKSCVGYSQRMWVIVEKNIPGWFGQSPYREIGKMESLRVKNAHINDVLKEYLMRMPGEYSKATMNWYRLADRLVKFESLGPDFFAYLHTMKVPNARKIEYKGRATEPINTSKDRQTNAEPELIAELREAEHEWFDHMEER